MTINSSQSDVVPEITFEEVNLLNNIGTAKTKSILLYLNNKRTGNAPTHAV